MAQIFSVFANHGHMIEPRLVSKIVSKEGAVIYETRPKEIVNFTKPQQAYMMTDILKDVIKRGTGKGAKVDGIELAGKTGTTNDNVDAWFCGYSPTIETIVWFGRDDNQKIGKRATGGLLATPAFAYYYRELLKLYPDTPRIFERPEGVYSGIVDGRYELYTDISPLPKNASSIAEERREQQERVEGSRDYVAQEEDIDPVESDTTNHRRGEDSILDMFGDTGDSTDTPRDINATIDDGSITMHPRKNRARNRLQIADDSGGEEIVEMSPEESRDDYIFKQSDSDTEDDSEHIDPINLKPKQPRSTVDEDSGSLF